MNISQISPIKKSWIFDTQPDTCINETRIESYNNPFSAKKKQLNTTDPIQRLIEQFKAVKI